MRYKIHILDYIDPNKARFKFYLAASLIVNAILLLCILRSCWALTPQELVNQSQSQEEKWKITAYCACEKCCKKSDGITASGKKIKYGYAACNWLPFGTKINIQGLGVFIVMDRGARSLFGSKYNHIKHIDIYLPTHKEALSFGIKYLLVKII